MAQLHMTASEYRTYMVSKKSQKQPKHRNKHVYVFEDGFSGNDKAFEQGHGKIVEQFDSIKEYNRWKELQLLEKAGKIRELNRQVPILIEDGFTSSDGKKHQPIYYKADFVYQKDGNDIIEDVKGQDKSTGKYLTTEAFNLKWKLLQGKYPSKKFVLY